MSVQKNTSNFLKHNGLAFTTILNSTMDLIPDAGALGIYCYLASKPENWEICNVHLENRFKKGREYIQRRMAILKSVGLMRTVPVKNEKGVILHWETTLLNAPETHNTGFPYSGKSYPQSTIRVSQNLAEPESGKTDTINKRSLQSPERAKKKERALSQKIPASQVKSRSTENPYSGSFQPDDSNIAFCNQHNLSMTDELESFLNRHRGSKTQYEFGRWIKNSVQYGNKQKSVQPRQELHSTVPEHKGFYQDVKIASPDVVNKYMSIINQKLSRMMINGHSKGKGAEITGN